MHRLALIVICLTVTGCGGAPADAPELHPASGVVTYNGEPLANAMVTLISGSGGKVAAGKSDASGTFILMTNGEDGAVKGTHKVTVSVLPASADGPAPEVGSEEYEKMMTEGAEPAKSPIPEKYSDAGTSGLTAAIVAGPNQIKVELAD